MSTLTLEKPSSDAGTGASEDPICAFYNRHPYPPPVENLDRARDEWRDDGRRRAEFHLLRSREAYRPDLDVLIAGCGTWQAAKFALCHPEARVLGIDVSTTSLEHTERLKIQYSLANLETLKLPIEQVASLGRNFDLVVCTGVLHHLSDPELGLRALRGVLNERGVIYLMVYARYGRAGIYLIQDYCRRLGIVASKAGIDDLLATLDRLPPDHPLAAALRGARDAHSADALADALLNPRDRAYTVPELFELIRAGGLIFGRWYQQAPYFARCGSMAATPHSTRLVTLGAEEQFAAMELWRGTMTTHSVVLHREPRPYAVPAPDDEADWLRQVPVRLPSAICVTERLPRGAAGVLLSRAHAFHDLFLPIDSAEKQLIDAIGGQRSLGEILKSSGSKMPVARASAFFETLFNYDQVVFDDRRD